MTDSTPKSISRNLQSYFYRPLSILGVTFVLSSVLVIGWSSLYAYPIMPLLALVSISLLLLIIAHRLLARIITNCQQELDSNSHMLEKSHHILQAQFSEQTQQLKKSHQNYQQLVESANSMILRWDTLGNIRYINAYALEFFGFAEDEIIGRNVMDTIVPKTESTGRDLAHMIEDIGDNPQKYVRNENENIKKDGVRIWVSWTNKAITDEQGNTAEILSIGNDITEKKIYERQIFQLAHFDHLTGLPNRTLLMNRISDAMQAANDKGWVLPIFYIDLDRFKPINDSLGHHNGDLLLSQLAARLTACLQHEQQTVARMGGDEFTVLLQPAANRQQAIQSANQMAQLMLDTMSMPYDLNGHQIFITGSIGIVLYPQDGTDHLTLMNKADTAMYQAKRQGKNCYLYYQPHMNSKAMERLQLETELRLAIQDEALTIHYQPTVNVSSGTLECIEALLRWQHPTRGNIPPEDFIPVAEESGLIIQLGTWVLEQAIKQAGNWQQSGHKDFVIAINLSMRQFEDKNLLTLIEQILQHSDISAHHIGLEITESTIMQDTEQGMKTLSQLNKMGVCLFIDDFGTGYSSLARLRDLPIHTVKIDKSFISDITTLPKNALIIDAIIAMAHSLNIKVIAEGVENRAQLDYLLQRDCQCIQGNVFAKAMPAEEMKQMFEQRFSLDH